MCREETQNKTGDRNTLTNIHTNIHTYTCTYTHRHTQTHTNREKFFSSEAILILKPTNKQTKSY